MRFLIFRRLNYSRCRHLATSHVYLQNAANVQNREIVQTFQIPYEINPKLSTQNTKYFESKFFL